MPAKRRKNKRRRMSALQRKYFGKRSNPRRRRRSTKRSNPRRRRNAMPILNRPRHRRRHHANPVRHHRRHRRNAPNLRGILEPALYGLIGFAAPPYIRRFAAKYFPQLSTQSPYITALIDGAIGYGLSIAAEKTLGATKAGNMMIGTGILVGTEFINAVAAGTVTLGNVPYSFPTSVASSPQLGVYPKRIGMGARPYEAPSQFNPQTSERYKRY